MPKKAQTSPTYNIITSQEMEAVTIAASQGKFGDHWRNQAYPEERIHQVPGAKHLVRLTSAASPGESPLLALEKLTAEQDADSALAMLYIVNVLAPPGARMVGAAEGWIDFDDVIDKIGWTPRNAADRRRMHERIQSVLEFGKRAIVTGQRSGAYKDKYTGKKRDTTIEASLWQVHATERPTQLELDAEKEAPIRAFVIIMSAWIPLLTSPDMAQYLPLGEALGSIPGNKPSGAWARVMGLSLASFWRRQPVAAFDGSVRPTRRELLERHPPKTGSVHDVLGSRDPRRAIEYWCGGLAALVARGIVAPTGEAAIVYEDMRAALPRQGWEDQWLDAPVFIPPGPAIAASVAERASELPSRRR